jgi:glycosyltransferase involved in cell wall biosynthesis
MADRKIKILFLIDRLLLGGTENQLILLTESLPRDKYELIIGVLYKTNVQSSMQGKTPIVDFNWRGMPYIKNISLLLRLRRYLDEEKFDILQTHFIESTIYGAWAARLCRPRPYLITTRRNLYHWVKDQPLSLRFLRHTVHWTDRILVNSQKVFDECQRMENIPQEKITLIQNAIEVEKLNGNPIDEAKREIGLPGVFPVIGVVSNLRPVKGLISFIKAAAEIVPKYKLARFVIVGKGPQKEELTFLARELGILDHFVFLGARSDTNKIIAAFDIAVQPSISESFSNVLLEYMASSKPVVATRVGDAEKIIEDGREGLLVRPNSPEELSAAILSLCRNISEAALMGKAARQKVEENWSSAKILETYQQFYRGIFLNLEKPRG